MNTENSIFKRIEALPEARKNTIIETLWLLGKLHSVDDSDIETLINASEQVEADAVKAKRREDFWEREEFDDEADNTPTGPTIDFENPTERDKRMIDAYVNGTWKPFEPMSENDTVLVSGIGTMLRSQAREQMILAVGYDTFPAYRKAASGPAYKEAE